MGKGGGKEVEGICHEATVYALCSAHGLSVMGYG